ncbi:CoA transferase [Nocardia stercoris]|uniref:2-methylfumaryl-CoA isomerase n=1 Tax=Nocardia stercoris TaxID=2483361 RepID=A0A3M2KUN3_9NOCA|nr:CoA transferase [Nocardia stercoris]RMI28851.1 2-methylfumaryl-CoA isomerase [Nocardia stercoris]
MTPVLHGPPTPPLTGLRVVEFASFVAGPSAGMTLAQLGAEVIRIDPAGGAADFHRWPVSQRTGASLYWASLNRGKRSVEIDVRTERGRELVLALSTAPGDHAGLVVDNAVGRPWFSYDALAARRGDVIKVHIGGRSDGGPAVDYTVNTEVGVTDLTGPADTRTPVNHVLPAWDLLAGTTATTALLAALHRRRTTGHGSDLRIALADVALAGVANLGWFSEVRERGDRPRHGNFVYGSFGADFRTGDDERVMVVALTPRQWQALCEATGTAKVVAALSDAVGADFDDEAARYTHRETLAAIMRPWFAARTIDEAAEALTTTGVLWSRYRTMSDVVTDFEAGIASPVLTELDQPGIGPVVSARNPIRDSSEYGPVAPAAALGADTDAVLAETLGLTDAELGALHDSGIIGGPC